MCVRDVYLRDSSYYLLLSRRFLLPLYNSSLFAKLLFSWIELCRLYMMHKDTCTGTEFRNYLIEYKSEREGMHGKKGFFIAGEGD